MNKKSIIRLLISAVVMFTLIVGGTYFYTNFDSLTKPKGEFAKYSSDSKVNIYYFYEENNKKSDYDNFSKLLADTGVSFPEKVTINPVSNASPKFIYLSEDLHVEKKPSIVIVNPKGYIIYNSNVVLTKEQIQYILQPYL